MGEEEINRRGSIPTRAACICRCCPKPCSWRDRSQESSKLSPRKISYIIDDKFAFQKSEEECTIEASGHHAVGGEEDEDAVRDLLHDIDDGEPECVQIQSIQTMFINLKLRHHKKPKRDVALIIAILV